MADSIIPPVKPSTISTPVLTRLIAQHRPDLTPYEELYKHLHAHPELSLQEEQTTATAAAHLRKLSPDIEITERIGGHGMVGILRNGPGTTILLRADTDALPVEEKTGLPYASKVTMKDNDGLVKPVMHACGHDMHVTSMLGAAELLISARETWTGTIIFLFQPAEERGAGAKAMVADGLYSKKIIPVPDVVLGQHVMPYKAGVVGVKSGLMACAADSFLVEIFGRGGHASQPHRTIDPVVVAAGIVTKLQTVVSREVSPDEMAVVTVGAIQAGMTENIIPDHAILKINTRTVTEKTRDKVLAALTRIINAECMASACPKPPTITPTSSFPFTINNASATDPVSHAFSSHFGEAFLPEIPRLLGSEDFSILGTAVDRPCCFWVVGMHDPVEWDRQPGAWDQKDVPINHSPFFAPAVQPTLEVSVDAMALAALTFVAKEV